MTFAKLDDVQLYYEEAGDGYPILLSHGGFGDITEWNPQVEALSQHYRVIRYDRRGCGRSRPMDIPQLAELWVEDMKQFMDSLGLEQAHLGGVSYGGMLLIEFLLKYQSMCKAAVIVSATARGRDGSQPRSVYFPNRLDELSSITVPTLVVQATNDDIFPPKQGEEMLTRMPNAELVVLDGGHTINNERPKEFNAAMVEFLGKVEKDPK
ncbi:MAG: alpha/beta hydrolase [Dehalococcoidia bacterium]|jgi:pimeloyl-ACP methyl ester carboxylesterase|nr:alpha/beta hydrolase [Dehalococcoidia bacterium]